MNLDALYCDQCGGPMAPAADGDGTHNHIRENGEVDYLADLDHQARTTGLLEHPGVPTP